MEAEASVKGLKKKTKSYSSFAETVSLLLEIH